MTSRRRLKCKQYFTLEGLCEVELGRVEGLYHLVYPELCWTFLAVAALIQLGHKAIHARDNFGGAGSHIIPATTMRQATVSHYDCGRLLCRCWPFCGRQG